MKVLGIDEAGRGPCIGPLVMCGYLVDEKKIPQLKKIGVKDSKMLTEKKRIHLEKQLKKIADDFILFNIPAKKIDKMRSVTNLNKMEIERMQEMINLLSPDKAVIDALEANTKRFHEKVSQNLNNGTKLITENFADQRYVEVGAASIMAKVCRDNEIKKLHKKHGFFGSGYPSDPVTINFLKDLIKKNKELPHFVRKSWMTIHYLKNEKEQSKLMKFVESE